MLRIITFILALTFALPALAQTFGSPTLVITAYKYANITSDTTTTVKASSGILHTICYNTAGSTGTATVYDNTAGSGTLIATVTLNATGPRCDTFDINFTTGLTIVTASTAGDITVSYF